MPCSPRPNGQPVLGLTTQDFFDTTDALTFLRETLAPGPQPAITPPSTQPESR